MLVYQTHGNTDTNKITAKTKPGVVIFSSGTLCSSNCCWNLATEKLFWAVFFCRLLVRKDPLVGLVIMGLLFVFSGV
jgi:hypothetical protein